MVSAGICPALVAGMVARTMPQDLIKLQGARGGLFGSHGERRGRTDGTIPPGHRPPPIRPGAGSAAPKPHILSMDAGGAMEQAVRQLFERYADFFARSLAGEPDPDEAAALYAPEFLAATPAGIATGRNDAEFLRAMQAGYDHYRSIGTREMRIRHLHILRVDEWHCLAHV